MNRTAASLSAALLAAAACATAWAADPKTNFMDHSTGLLIDANTAKQVMGENIPAKVWKLYPANKYTFVSQVEGGMNGTTCVVSARVMLLPLTPTMKAVLFRPQKTATAFDSQVNSSTDACRALAKDKLKEATTAVVSALVKA
jgi:hypothetical protein